MSEFSWGRPEWLRALWILVPLVLLVPTALRRRDRDLARLGRWVRDLRLAVRSFHRVRLLLLLGGIALATIALARPRLGYHWREVHMKGLDLVLVLDVSRSMDAQDVAPSRMERARREILDLLEVARGDRVGLVLAAGGAYARVPLTEDFGALRTILRDSDTNTLKAQGTDLGRAIEVGLEVLGAAGDTDQVLLILSDGEDQLGFAREAAAKAAAQGVRIYAMGIGTEDGAPIPVAGGGFLTDEKGAVVITRLDRATLLDLAREGGGGYADSVAGTDDLDAIYREGIRGGQARTAERQVRREQVWNERFAWPLGLGLLLCALAAGRRAPALLLGLLLVAPVARAASPELEALLRQQVERPQDLALAERVGEALYKEGQYNRAYDVLKGVAQRSDDPAQQSRAAANAARSAYRAGRLEEAARTWERLSAQAPEHPTAKRDAEAVRQEIARRLQEAPPERPPPSGDPSAEPPSQGEPPQGSSAEGPPPEGAEPPGDPQAGASPEGQPREGPSQPGSDGARTPSPAPGEGQQPAVGATAEGGVDSGEPTASGAELPAPGSVHAAEAERLFDGVREGSPRVELRPDARRGGKGW